MGKCRHIECIKCNDSIRSEERRSGKSISVREKIAVNSESRIIVNSENRNRQEGHGKITLCPLCYYQVNERLVKWTVVDQSGIKIRKI